ncbi:MAG: twin-arginine translocase TatA/TatE family subunit [Firmicutes bacterium]|nr:twin-arginine translocase TatA/TatE family subunit [Bacillota bacterium]
MGTGEWLVILVVALLLFGPSKLPHMGRAVGVALREFRQALRDGERTLPQETVEASTPATTDDAHRLSV